VISLGIDDLRKEIDKLDETILHNLASRKNIIKEIAKLKKLMKIPVPDAEREKTVLEKLKNKAGENGIDAEMVHSIYSLIFENSRLEQEIENNDKKCTIKEIGIVGFGRIGKLAAKHLSNNFNVYISNKSGKIETKGKKVISSTLEEACGKDLVIIAVPISELESVLKKIAPLLKKDSLVADVCSVKEYAIDLMEKILPKNVQILGTHPLFGPDSAAESILGRKVVLCRARANDELYNQTKSYLKSMGLIVIEASPKEHDMQMAKSLVLTHVIGRALIDMKAKNLDIDTRGYRDLINILDTVKNDSMQFFEDINKYNKYAAEARKSFIQSLNKVEETVK
jgi:prephenate dehydrogenase